jgi:hypothetical protein
MGSPLQRGEPETSQHDGRCKVCLEEYNGCHACDRCHMPVHSICGTGIGPEEYGQKVICFVCSPKKGRGAPKRSKGPAKKGKGPAKPLAKKGTVSKPLPKAMRAGFRRKSSNMAKAKGTHENTVAAFSLDKSTLDMVPFLQGGVDDPYLGKKVVYLLAEEEWLSDKRYKVIGSFPAIGEVAATAVQNNQKLYQIQWMHTKLRTLQPIVSSAIVVKGMDAYLRLQQSKHCPRTWDDLNRNLDTVALPFEPIEMDDDADSDGGNGDGDGEDVTEFDAEREYNDYREITCGQDVDELLNLNFDKDVVIKAPTDLYEHADKSRDSAQSYIKPEFEYLFEDMECTAFFAFIPISYWKEVVVMSNERREVLRPKEGPIDLDELMVYIGIIFYMSLVGKGEYENYFKDGVEEHIFGCAAQFNCTSVIPLRRFVLIRRIITFGRKEDTDADDPYYRFRSLVNVLKINSKRFIVCERDCTIDETSVANRNSHSKDATVFNKSKPCGKHHFKFYSLTCAR